MKPKYIFSAVFAICLIMGGLLPRLASPHGRVSAQALAAPAAQIAPTALSALPITPTQVEAQVIPTQPPAVMPTVAAQPTHKPSEPQPTIAPIEGPAIAAPDDSAPVKTLPPGGVPLTADLPDLASFAASLKNGQANQVVGVYVAQLFAFPVVQQPAGDDQFVSTADKTVTQYSLPAQYGVVGLLAHNTLSGLDFFGLKNGQEVVLVYGDGRQARYKITGSQRYQALSPTDNHSNFVDLNGPGSQVMSYQQLFDRVYTKSNQLVFQTCFEANGDLSWGRVFYTADPVS